MLGLVSSHTAAETRQEVASLASQPTVAGHSGDHPPDLETLRAAPARSASDPHSGHSVPCGRCVQRRSDPEHRLGRGGDPDARGVWAESGLVVGPVTWHEAHSFPPCIVTDRDVVLAPDSVGVTIGEETGPYARVVLYHYGWVDLDIVNWTTDDLRATSGTPVRSVEEFASFLDHVHERLVVGTDQ